MQNRLKLTFLAALLLAFGFLFLAWGLDDWMPYIIDLRFRKLAALLLVGCCIGVATIIFQTLAANNILTPGMLGFDAMFLFMQTGLVIAIGTISYSAIPLTVKFLTEIALMVSVSVLFFSTLLRRTSGDVNRLLLIGIIIGILLHSLNAFLLRLLDPSDFAVLQSVMFASFGAVDPLNLALAAVLTGLCIIASVLIAPQLDVLTLGRKKAISLGVNYNLVIIMALGIVSILIAVATSLVGPITFLGLLVASLARMVITSYRHILLLPTAAIISASILVAGQFVFERILHSQSALGIIIEFIGGILFFILLWRKGTK